MKPLLIKAVLLGSLILFGSILLIMLLGYIACAAGADQRLFCGTMSCVGAVSLIITFSGTSVYIIRSLIHH